MVKYLITIYDNELSLKYSTLTIESDIPRITNLLIDSKTYKLESVHRVKNYEPLTKVLKYIKENVKPNSLNY